MQTLRVKHLLLAALLLPAVATRPADLDSLWAVCESRQTPVPERSFAVVDVRTPRTEIGKSLYRVTRHPGLDSLLTEEEEQRILAEINRRCNELGKDSLFTCELFYVLRPFFDRLHFEDPHYRIEQQVYADHNVYRSRRRIAKLDRRLRMPPFTLCRINDTLLIDRSLDTGFHRGDLVVAINNVPTAEYLKYSYDDRYTFPATLMSRYYYSHLVDSFRIGLVRAGRFVEVETTGLPLYDALFRLSKAEETDRNIRIYADARTGYIAIPEFFPDNSRLIRVVRKALLDFRKQGCTSVILDLRRNPGGNGHAFDKLLSLFLSKPTVDYCRGQRIRATRSAMKYYDFITEEMLGSTVEMPDKEVVRTFETDPKLYVPGMDCYVLVGRDTGSIAASFVNILQYNHAALLVGEPLRHNALKYGEEDKGSAILPTLLAESAVSMVEIDEYTRRDDGYVMPDIPIPAVAAEYADGRDAVLEKLLTLIKEKI